MSLFDKIFVCFISLWKIILHDINSLSFKKEYILIRFSTWRTAPWTCSQKINVNWQKQPPEAFVLKNFAKFTGKHLWQSLCFNKVAGLRPATLFKKRPWHRCFPVNFAKFLRTPFLQNTSGRLLLNWIHMRCEWIHISWLNINKIRLNI